MNYYISKGLQKDKILVGVTTAGTHFKLGNTNLTGVGAPIVKSTKPRISDLWELPDRFVYPEVRPLQFKVELSYELVELFKLRPWHSSEI